MHSIMQKAEWGVIDGDLAVTPGIYTSATGTRYEVTAYHPSDDTVTCIRQDNGVTKRIPRPMAKAVLEPLSKPTTATFSDNLLVIYVVVMGLVLGLIWWSW